MDYWKRNEEETEGGDVVDQKDNEGIAGGKDRSGSVTNGRHDECADADDHSEKNAWVYFEGGDSLEG